MDVNGRLSRGINGKGERKGKDTEGDDDRSTLNILEIKTG
jgi:hypothetical protein